MDVVLKKKRIIFISTLSILSIIACVSLCAGFANENNSNVLKTQDTEKLFSDVKKTDWFYSDINYVNEKGLMQGTCDALFAPDNPTTRGMLVTILWRLDGEPVEKGNSFSDVKSDTYYHDAVVWASKCGIVNGYSDTVFSPDDNITREQLASILYRYAEYKNYDTTKKSELNKYADKNQISDYALSAMQWANGNGIITGTYDETLSPQGYALRCQIAAILKRFCTQIMPTDSDSGIDDTWITEQTETEQPSNKDSETKKEDRNNHAVNNNFTDKTSNDSTESENSTENSTENNGYPLISVSDISSRPGDNVQISVTLNNNPGVLGMALTVYYDETNLTLQSIENGEAFQDVLDLTPSKTLNSGIRFLWDGIDIAENDIKDGTILTMNFKVNGNAQEDKYPITLKYSDGDIVDKNLASISPQIENGYITIINK